MSGKGTSSMCLESRHIDSSRPSRQRSIVHFKFPVAPASSPARAASPLSPARQMAQVMSPHQTLTQRYRIYATNTGDASGAPLEPGRYTARFENLHSIWVTVTAR